MLVTTPFYIRHQDVIRLEIAVNTAEYDIFTAAGSPTEAENIELYIHPGVYVYSTTYSVAPITTGIFPVGSTLKIINDGYIVGKGGNGGRGAIFVGCKWMYQSPADRDGQPGGNAITTNIDITIDNTNGYIWAGGGGGGGGGGWYCGCSKGQWMGGNGGGGGAGYDVGLGGLPGAGCYYILQPGGNGTLTTGGLGGVSADPYYRNLGGAGGNLGMPGITGSSAHGFHGGGGAAGRAIKTNGYTITFEGGNNPTQVIGAVSP